MASILFNGIDSPLFCILHFTPMPIPCPSPSPHRPLHPMRLQHVPAPALSSGTSPTYSDTTLTCLYTAIKPPSYPSHQYTTPASAYPPPSPTPMPTRTTQIHSHQRIMSRPLALLLPAMHLKMPCQSKDQILGMCPTRPCSQCTHITARHIC